tara:strand:+ start:189 stop:548 length:360 start_codon:yes stop_codon:yes gene_type:complete
MPSKSDLLNDINAMATEVGTAMEKLHKNEMVTLDGIEPRIREVMEAVADLPPDDAVEMRPALVSLLEKMETFSSSLQEKIDQLRTIEADTSQNPPTPDTDSTDTTEDKKNLDEDVKAKD